MKSAYKRVMLKLSGEALGLDGKLFDHEHIAHVAQVIKQVADSGVQVCIVIGAGNIWRGRQGPSAQMNAVIADQMGMLGTAINCLCMRDALERTGLKAYVQSAIDMPRFCESYNTQAAIDHLEKGHVVLFACGSGNPFFSTDTAVVLRAIECEVDCLLMAKNIDGIYSADPLKDPCAVRYDEITYKEILEKELRALDMTATTLCLDNNIKAYAFELKDPMNIYRVAMGEKIGTEIHN